MGWCEQCRLDLVGFASRPEKAMPQGFDIEDEAAMERLSRRLGELKLWQEEFVRQRIRERLG